MKIFKKEKPDNFALVDCIDGNRYIIIKHKFPGFSKYDNFSVYKWNADLQTIDRKSICEISSYKVKLKEYAPWIFTTIPLIAFAVSQKLINLKGRTALDERDIKSIFLRYKNAYESSKIDGQLFIAPDIK